MRLARALTAAILLGAFSVAVLGALFLARHGYGPEPVLVMRLALGGGAMLLALLLSFAAPRIVLWDCRMLSRLQGRAICAGPFDLVLVRLTALLLLLLGGGVLGI